MPEKLKTGADKIGVERVKIVCSNCSFKFARDKESRLSATCPNCGSKHIHHYKPLTADYFIRTVKTHE